jgi:hypothetical protein
MDLFESANLSLLLRDFETLAGEGLVQLATSITSSRVIGSAGRAAVGANVGER